MLWENFNLEKKIGEFWAPGAEIWLFKKKNMDRSIDLAVQHSDYAFLLQNSFVVFMHFLVQKNDKHEECILLKKLFFLFSQMIKPILSM